MNEGPIFTSPYGPTRRALAGAYPKLIRVTVVVILRSRSECIQEFRASSMLRQTTKYVLVRPREGAFTKRFPPLVLSFLAICLSTFVAFLFARLDRAGVRVFNCPIGWSLGSIAFNGSISRPLTYVPAE